MGNTDNVYFPGLVQFEPRNICISFGAPWVHRFELCGCLLFRVHPRGVFMKSAQRLFSLRHSEIFEAFNPVELGRLLGILEEL